MIYLVSYSWYETYSPTILEGPEVPDWKAYCLRFLDIAAQRAVATNVDTYVGWQEIAECLVELLEAAGYKKLKPPEFTLWGGYVRDKPDDHERTLNSASSSLVKAHNNAITPVFERP